MLACLETEDIQFQTLIQLAIFMGARRGELVALKFSDVDFEQSKITIERAAVKLKGQKTVIKPPKDYEVRTVTVNQKLPGADKAAESRKGKRGGAARNTVDKRRLAVHHLERRNNEPSNSNETVQQVPGAARLTAPEISQPAAHIGYIAALCRRKHQTSSRTARTRRH